MNRDRNVPERSESPRAIPSLLQRVNARQVLDAMSQLGPCSRAAIRERTGISTPTISKLIDTLIEAGIVEEEDDLRRTAGRPSKVFRLATGTMQLVGVVVDIRTCTVLSAGLDGRIDPRRVVSIPTPAAYEDMLNAITTAIQDLLARQDMPCRGIGLSMPGLVNAPDGRVVFSPNLHFIDKHCPARDLAARTGLETVMLQEEHALCLAEQMFGTARDTMDFAMIDISAGLGMGVVSGGQYVGGHAGYGGELGHAIVAEDGPLCGCGNRGCLETVATDTAVARAISQRLGQRLDIDQLVERIASGRMEMPPEIDRAIGYLARGIGMVVNVFNPTRVFVYGRMFDAAPHLFEQLTTRVCACALPPNMSVCRLVRTRGNKQLGALAAIIDHRFAGVGCRLTVSGPQAH